MDGWVDRWFGVDSSKVGRGREYEGVVTAQSRVT